MAMMMSNVLLFSVILVLSARTQGVYGQYETTHGATSFQPDGTAEPPTLSVVTVFSTNVTLEWNHIYCPSSHPWHCRSGRNGVQSYRVSILSQYDSSRRYVTVPVPEGTNVGAVLNYTVSGLNPSSTYTFQINAANDNGGSYYTISERVTARTLAPNYIAIQIKLHDVSNCLQWREVGPFTKLTSVRQSISREVNKRCHHCRLNEGRVESSTSQIFLRGAFFMCFTQSEHYVTYRVQVVDIATATAQETVTALQQWMASSEIVTITVDYNRYYVSNNCSLVISSFDDPECSDIDLPYPTVMASTENSTTVYVATSGGIPKVTSNPGAERNTPSANFFPITLRSDTNAIVSKVVGANVGVVLILAVVGIIVLIILLVFLRTRRKVGHKYDRLRETSSQRSGNSESMLAFNEGDL